MHKWRPSGASALQRSRVCAACRASQRQVGASASWRADSRLCCSSEHYFSSPASALRFLLDGGPLTFTGDACSKLFVRDKTLNEWAAEYIGDDASAISAANDDIRSAERGSEPPTAEELLIWCKEQLGMVSGTGNRCHPKRHHVSLAATVV